LNQTTEYKIGIDSNFMDPLEIARLQKNRIEKKELIIKKALKSCKKAQKLFFQSFQSI
jgi:hypothetical protein